MAPDTRSFAIILFGEALSHPGLHRDGGMSIPPDRSRGRIRSKPHGHTVQKPRTASFCSPCSRRGIALHRSRFGIAYRCVSAFRISRAATRFIAGPASGNRLSAGHQGTRSHSTSAQPTGWLSGGPRPCAPRACFTEPPSRGGSSFEGPSNTGLLSADTSSARLQGLPAPGGWSSAERCASTLGRRAFGCCVMDVNAPRRGHEDGLHRA
jgi:hypothetical protein